MAGMRVWRPEFGEHVGHDSAGGPVLGSGQEITIQLDGLDGTPGTLATMGAEEAEKLAGHLIALALQARQQIRSDNKIKKEASRG